ncbi:retrotransposon protein [Cucumis melo var. makuwa]|uniref:Retrotransposon protein n=1 Tax=Cucumis melo var. makuwa TaxID=1194695 RepID=A0A5D3C4H6_CUCMM|nr:retrotransposon protein [Cucumis melo var. makuwa]TYK06118.1 retrotransposon protein [Cucumis melo var. makuwa]
MAQKLAKERLETTEREIRELKEIIMGLAKGVERLAKEVKENRENSESRVYRAEHSFEINDLTETKKVKVAVVSFAQDEVMSCHPTSREQCRKEAQLVNDHKIALKLALSEFGALGMGKKCKVRDNRELMLFIMNEEEENELLADLGEEIANVDGET